MPTYAGRVKCIYIDPPYNTGNEGWIYNDRVNSPLMRQWLADNKPVDGEDLERHDKWLCMMWPRLHLLRELLSEDGVIFVSIDDNEQHHLRTVMDEVFGEEAFIASVTWKKRGGPPNDRRIGNIHDFVLIYGSESGMNLRPRTGNSGFTQDDGDGRGPWRLEQFHGNTRGGRWVDSLYYPITNPTTGEEHYPPSRRNWVYNRERVAEMIANREIVFGKDGKSMPQRKRYLRDVRPGLTWPTMWQSDTHSKFPMNHNGSSELADVFNAPADFDNPKPVGLIDRVLRIATDPNDIVLDSFAGSGTTAHAVLALNKEDDGNRRFILVECEDYADTITAERVRRVINGVPNARDATLREGLDGEFTYCTLGDPISIETMLNGENLPGYASLATYLLHCATGIAANPSHLAANAALSDDTGFFYESEHVRYHLLYRPHMEWLRGEKGALNSTRAEAVSQAARAVGKSAVVFAPLRFVSQNDLSAMGITFCQLPYEFTASRAQALEV